MAYEPPPITVPNGGTGASTLLNHGIVIGQGSSPITAISPSTAGFVLTSNGISANPSFETPPAGDIPIGSLVYFSTNESTTYPNPRWIVCDGSILLQADYPELFSRIGLINGPASNWTFQTLSANRNLNSVTFGNSQYVTVGASGRGFTSTDGITWSSEFFMSTSSTMNSIAFGNSLYVAVGNGAAIQSSTDASTWDFESASTASTFLSIIFENSLFVAGGVDGILFTSTDAITWNAQTSSTSSTIYCLSFGAGLYAYGGGNGAYATSTDTITWTPSSIGTSSSILAMTFGNSLFVSGGSGGILFTSTDGLTWDPRTSTTTLSIKSLTYGNNLYLAACSNGSGNNLILTSTDAITWDTSYTATTPTSINGSTALGGHFLVVGNTAGVFTANGDYPYNISTQFQLPSNSNTPIVAESQSNFQTKLFIKAL